MSNIKFIGLYLLGISFQFFYGREVALQTLYDKFLFRKVR